MDPNFIEARFNSGLVYEQKEMFGEAIAEFRKAIRISGGALIWWPCLVVERRITGDSPFNIDFRIQRGPGRIETDDVAFEPNRCAPNFSFVFREAIHLWNHPKILIPHNEANRAEFS